MIDMKKVGVAVVGLGRIGRVHSEILFTKVENVRLVAVSDIIEDLAKSVGEKYKIKWYTDYDKLLRDEEVEAVFITTPTFLHKDMIIKALEAGKHVFTEKPMTVTVEEAKEVISAANKYGLKLMVGYMRRFDDAYMNAKEKIKNGEIGQPLAFINIARDPGAPPGWAADPKKSGGIFLDMLSHDFDMARNLMESEVKKLYVLGGAKLYDEIKEKGDLDVVTINFEFANGAYGMIHGSRKSVFGYDLRTEVMGTEGTIYVGSQIDPNLALGTKNGVVYRGVQWFWSRFYDAYVREDQAFIEAILEDKDPPITAEDGLRVVEIAEACWRSWREGKPVTL
ncbi:MAG: inositol 2-dehydrogenase [Thermoprotei archaeon]|nr:MAG: inositol 2-dehydrogenase [Thermoprotei archaeon]